MPTLGAAEKGTRLINHLLLVIMTLFVNACGVRDYSIISKPKAKGDNISLPLAWVSTGTGECNSKLHDYRPTFAVTVETD